MKTKAFLSKLHIHAAMVLAIIVALMVVGGGLAAPILLDPTFDHDGKVVTDIGGDDDPARAIAIYPDGRIIVAGYTDKVLGETDFALARYTTNGALDTAFGGDGIVTTDINRTVDFGTALALQPDGRIVLAGVSSGEIALARYNTNGSLDKTFDLDGIVVTHVSPGTEIAYAVAIQQDGKIVVAGTHRVPWAWGFRVIVVRYNNNGSLDENFGNTGRVELVFPQGDSVAHAVAIQPDGKILVAGVTGGDFFIWRFNTSGQTDYTFSGGTTDFRGGDDEANAMVIQSDGRIIVAGTADSVPSGDFDFAMVRYLTNGLLDRSFGQDGFVRTNLNMCVEMAHAVTLQSDGRIVLAGDSYCPANDGSGRSLFPRDFLVTRYTVDGLLDASFNGYGFVYANIGASDIGYAVASQKDGKIVVAGDSDGNFSLARFGGTPPAFVSNAMQDGWVLESQQNSNVGGSMNRGNSTLSVGDDALNRQYRSILSFDTDPLPDNAVISKATLTVKMQGVVGIDPFTTHGSLIADIKKGYFYLIPGLEIVDFQAAASKNGVGKFTPITGKPGWYQLVLTAANYPLINLTGWTQFRLRFTMDDNNNHIADYVRFFSGNYINASVRPTLVVEFTLP